MAKRREFTGCGPWRLMMAGCAWACALLAAVAVDAHPDVDTSTGLGDNTLTNSGRFLRMLSFHES